MNKKKDPQAHAKNASEAKNASFSRMYGILVENSVSQKYQIVWHNIPVLDSWFVWKFAILRPQRKASSIHANVGDQLLSLVVNQ